MDETATVAKKHGKLCVFLIAVLILLLVAAAAAGIILYKVTRPLNDGRFTAEATVDFKQGFMKAMLIGGETEFSNDDFNSMLAYSAAKKREKAKAEGKSEKVTLTELEFKPDGQSKLYARAFYGPFTLDVIADIDINLDKDNNVVEFKFTDAVIGDFHVSPETIIEKYKASLEEDGEETDMDFMKFTSTSVTFPATYSYEIFGKTLDFGFDGITVGDGKMTVNAKKPLGDWGEIVYSFLFNDK